MLFRSYPAPTSAQHSTGREGIIEQLLGTLINMAERICGTVTDWSLPRPMLPVASFRAWVQASHVTYCLFDETGEAAWAYASQHLAEMLEAGYAMYVQDIA